MLRLCLLQLMTFQKLQQLTLLAKADGVREKAEQRKELNQLTDNKLLELENCP